MSLKQFMKRLAGSLTAAAAITAVAMAVYPQATEAAPADVAEGRATLSDLSAAFNQVAESASPAVVFIEVEKNMSQGFHGGEMDPRDFLEQFFGGPGGRMGPRGPHGQMPMPDMEPGEDVPVPFGQGSGFLISEDGYIVTNHHVVGEADKVNVTMADGRQFEAKLVGSDPETEIALIKVEGTGLPHLKLADSDAIKIGDWVVAIGSPFGQMNTVTTGIVSARGRGELRGIVNYADFIQTDAAINPGNSGGPLLDLNGQVVGMNTAILSRSGGYMGIGFAIPVNMIKYVENELQQTGTVKRGFLGINIQNLTPDLAEMFKVNQNNGVLVADVQEDSPAAEAGLQRDDVITAFAGQPVTEVGSFRSRVATTVPGTEVVLTVVRGGQPLEQKVTVGALNGDAQAAAEGGAGKATQLGLTVQNLSADLAEQLGYQGEKGVVVTGVKPYSAAAKARLEQGDLIQEVSRQAVTDVKSFQKAIEDAKAEGKALLLVRKGEGAMYTVIDLGK